MSDSNCCFFTHIQVSQEAGKMVWYSHLFKNFLVCCDPHSQRLVNEAISIVNEAEVDVFLEFPCFLPGPINFNNLISDPSTLSKPTLYIWKLSVHVLLKPSLKDFEYNLANMWNECNCMVVWIVFDIAFIWNWNENWTFPVVATAEFSKFADIVSTALQQHHLLGF